MVEESLTSSAPVADRHPKPSGESQTVVDRKTAARKSESSSATARGGGRQQRLKLHLLIGLMMVVVAIAGYAFFGPAASAARISNYRPGQLATNITATDVQTPTGLWTQNAVSTSQPTIPSNYNTTPTDGLAALQAEMNEITRKMNALKAENTPLDVAPSAGTGAPTMSMTSPGEELPYNGLSVGSIDQTLATLDQMMLTMHDMIAKVDRMGSQVSASGGHAGHH